MSGSRPVLFSTFPCLGLDLGLELRTKPMGLSFLCLVSISAPLVLSSALRFPTKDLNTGWNMCLVNAVCFSGSFHHEILEYYKVLKLISTFWKISHCELKLDIDIVNSIKYLWKITMKRVVWHIHRLKCVCFCVCVWGLYRRISEDSFGQSTKEISSEQWSSKVATIDLGSRTIKLWLIPSTVQGRRNNV